MLYGFIPLILWLLEGSVSVVRITGSCFITAGIADLPGLRHCLMEIPGPFPGDHISLINLLMGFREGREQGFFLL